MKHSQEDSASLSFLMAAVADVAGAFHAYRAIHDDIFGFSFRKVIPIPFIFKPINYELHQTNLKFIREALVNSLSQLPPSSPSATELLQSLREYTVELEITVECLEDICCNMQQKIDGKIDYSSAAYRSDLASYERRVSGYQQSGERLNIAVQQTS